MNLLITEPTERSPDKFIRGHLLNEHLGGRGNAENLFPITANANKEHLTSTESRIKRWVLKPKPEETQYWAFYEVKVQNITSKLGGGKKNADNFVNCTFACRANRKDSKGKTVEEFSTVITSTYHAREKAKTL